MKTTLGLYRPGTSPLHRMPAGVKLAALVAAGVASTLVTSSWPAALGCLAVVLLLYPAAGFGPRTAWAQLRPMVVLLALTTAFQAWATGWQRALSVTAMLVALVLLAALVTLTTRTTALVDVVVWLCRPLERFGLDAERVALVINLGIRCVPLVAAIASEVREAQVARVGDFSLRAFAVPLIVRCLRDADSLGDALVARGVDD